MSIIIFISDSLVKRVHCLSLYFHCFVFDVFFRVKGEDIRLMLWDTAGQEEFDAITKAYYRGDYVIFISIF